MAAHDSRNLHLIDMIDARLTVFLQPGLCNKVADGLREDLDNSLLRYLDDHEAVLLGYKNIRVVTKQALLTPWFPYLTIEAQAELLLFRPVPGKILVGRVHKVNDGMLGILVLGGINASVPAEQMPDGFMFDAQNHCWVPDGDYSRAIMRGDFVACRVLSAPVTDPEEHQLLFNLDATLRDPEAGLCAKQTDLQNQKRSHLAATHAAGATVQPGAHGTVQTDQGGADQHGDYQQQRKERNQDRGEKSSSKKDKKRKREQGIEQSVAKTNKIAASITQTPQQLQAKLEQGQQQQQPVLDGLSGAATPAAAGAGDPATPPRSSKKDRKHKHKDGSHKHSSSKIDKKHKHKDSSRRHSSSKGQHEHSSSGTKHEHSSGSKEKQTARKTLAVVPAAY
eukprot:GHUV01003873.1.p1 GENE.GHUV01003873.1~~GHUV01003873.1.p1  ORF type:complete len:393 (+),score=128.84 GHUV01003873.1:2790-3968(+)